MAPIKIFYPNIPEDLKLRNEPTSTCLFRLFSAAVSSGLAPKTMAKAGLKNITGRLSDQHITFIVDIKNRFPSELKDIPDGRIIGMMVYAYILKHQAQKKASVEESTGSYSWREPQIQYYNQISPALVQNKIVLAEASTGIGKGRVMARLAYEAALDKRGPVVVAAPSVATLIQNFREWQIFTKDKKDAPEAGLIIGRQCFIDLDNLQMVLSSEDILPETKINASRWIETGAGKTPGSNTDPIHSFDPSVSCLMEDLINVAPELSAYEDRIILSDDSDSIGYQSYRSLQERTYDAPVKFSTHAMVALDRVISSRLSPSELSNGAILGEYHTLFIDEAHSFEANVSNIFTRNLSIFSLKTQIRSSDYGSQAGRDRVLNACDKIIGLAKNLKHAIPRGELFLFPKDWENNIQSIKDLRSAGLFNAFGELDKALKTVSRSKKEKAPAWLYEARQTMKCCPPPACEGEEPSDLDFAEDKPVPRSWSTLLLTLSPKMGYLSMSAGTVSIRKILEKIWLCADKGVALISATLLLPDGLGGRNGKYSCSVLGLSQNPKTMSRVHECSPVIPGWVTAPVRMMHPDPALYPQLAADLTPPGKDCEPEENSLWLDSVASQITNIAVAAKGGSLVLLSAYDRQEELLNRLEKSGLKDRLVYQSRGGVQFSLARYKNMVLAGKKPIWLAVGSPAWMGLDLNDRDIPSLLSDLIIPQLPFGLTQGVTARWRAKTGAGISLGYPPLVAECIFSFRQGIGRLVRHDGARDKNLWILDSRPWTLATNGSRQRRVFYTPFKEILKPYSNGSIAA